MQNKKQDGKKSMTKPTAPGTNKASQKASFVPGSSKTGIAKSKKQPKNGNPDEYSLPVSGNSSMLQ